MLSGVGRWNGDPPRMPQLVRLAWRVANVPPDALLRTDLLSDAPLLELWSATRMLCHSWLARLTRVADPDFPASGKMAFDQFRELAGEVLVSDMLVRVYCTVLACGEALRSRTAVPGAEAAARPVLDRAFDHVDHARRRILEALVSAGEPVAEVDRLRRRCERWTDSLIGRWIVQFGISAYAHDARRAWDFGEDASGEEEPSRLLLLHSYHAAFNDPLLDAPVTGEGWGLLTQQMQQLLDDDAAAGDSPLGELAAATLTAEQATGGRMPQPDRPGSLLELCLRTLQDRTTGSTVRGGSADQ
ncbi:MAG: hypothetical protein SFV23_11470 [Planctomycetaceae bacterium]|nr:hypothetical protein [Planctomycetaceae bacterium]